MADAEPTRGAQDRLQRARSEFQASLARQASLEQTGRYLTIAIVVVVLGFLVAGYSRAKANFAPEQVQQSLVTQGPEMVTLVSEAIMETASEVVPVYYEQAQVKSVEVMPQAALVFEKEVAEFSQSATEKVIAQLDDALKEVHKTQETALRQTFPDLTEEQSQQLINAMLGTVEEELEGLTGYILSKTVGDIARLDQTLKGFDTKGLPDSEAELSRLMLHHLLLLLDTELMEMKLETPPAEGGK